MLAQLTPSKRQHEQGPEEVNDGNKLQKTAALGSEDSPSKRSPESSIIRVVYPASRIADVIGENVSIISEVYKETGAKVHAEEAISDSHDRVIIITIPDKGIEAESDKAKAEDKQPELPEPVDDAEKHGEADKEKKDVPVADSQSENGKETSSVQKALLLLFDKLINGFSETKEGDEESSKPSLYVVRLLIFSSQVGCLLGKSGSVIKKVSSESGADIQILPKDKVPSCASSSDELVQISGELEGIKKALHSVSRQLLESNNIPEQDYPSTNNVGESSKSSGPRLKHDRSSSSNRHLQGGPAAPHSRFHDVEASIHGRMNFPHDALSFRLLCSEDKIGGVIGKGGSIIKALQHETGCDIKVQNRVAGSEDRMIIISGPAHPDDGISPPQDALLRVQSRIYKAAPESKEKIMIAKLLVFSSQIGCLLGKGGSVIAEMRNSTGAYIKILGKDHNPKCASENDEIIQINGEFGIVQEALVQITARLKNLFFRDAFPPLGQPPNPSFLDQMHKFPPFMGRSEFSPSRTFSNRGPPFNKFNDHHPFPHDFPGPGIPHHLSERMSSTMPWGPQGPIEGGGSPMGFPEYPRVPQRRPGVFSGGNPLAIITSTTVEVVVPSFVVPVIYGEGGGCLRQICEISDAKVTITDPKPGATETMIIIYGTPEQTNAAQSLIQAFVISETEAT